MITPYERGRRMEQQAVEDLRKLGYEAQRTAGSHGPFDVVAWSAGFVWLIQVKRVDNSAGIAPAISEARTAWEDHQKPDIPWVVCKVWVRYEGAWHTFRLD